MDGFHGPCMIAPKIFGLDELGWVGLGWVGLGWVEGEVGGGRGKSKEK